MGSRSELPRFFMSRDTKTLRGYERASARQISRRLLDTTARIAPGWPTIRKSITGTSLAAPLHAASPLPDERACWKARRTTGGITFLLYAAEQ